MRTIPAAQLARNLGISARTASSWCQRIPNLAYKRAGKWVIRLSELEKRPGFDAIKVFTHTQKRWVKAVSVAALSGMPRRTFAYWCKNNPRIAIRIGRIWYVCPEDLGATEEQLDELRRSGQTGH